MGERQTTRVHVDSKIARKNVYNLEDERIFNIAESPWLSVVVIQRYVHVPHWPVTAEQLLQVVPTV